MTIGQTLVAVRLVLRCLDALPAGVAEGIWRHGAACRPSAGRTCLAGERQVRTHLLPLLLTHQEWDVCWDADAALQSALALRRLPTLLNLAPTAPGPAADCHPTTIVSG